MQEGNIGISLENLQNDKDVIISVRDTGSGIDLGIMPRLFTKFALWALPEIIKTKIIFILYSLFSKL